jgi:hypothetical protein
MIFIQLEWVTMFHANKKTCKKPKCCHPLHPEFADYLRKQKQTKESRKSWFEPVPTAL